MKKTVRRTRLTMILLVGVALFTATVFSPRPARADAATAATVGGIALLGMLFYGSSNYANAGPRAALAQTLLYPTTGSMFRSSPASAAVVYSSISPAQMQAQMQQTPWGGPASSTAYAVPLSAMQPVVPVGQSPSNMLLYQSASPRRTTAGQSTLSSQSWQQDEEEED